MTRSNQSIHELFDMLQKQFGTFPQFEDVSAAVLEAEKAQDALLAEDVAIAQQVAA